MNKCKHTGGVMITELAKHVESYYITPERDGPPTWDSSTDDQAEIVCLVINCKDCGKSWRVKSMAGFRRLPKALQEHLWSAVRCGGFDELPPLLCLQDGGKIDMKTLDSH